MDARKARKSGIAYPRFRPDLEYKVELLNRQAWSCVYCDVVMTDYRLATIDHIIAGSTISDESVRNHYTNTVIACLFCNSRKGNTPYTVFTTAERIVKIDQIRMVAVAFGPYDYRDARKAARNGGK